MIKVSSKSEAWKVAKGYLGETKLDEKASERAGYEIYKNDKGEWVSDLGSRLEIVTVDGGTVNVWIDEEVKKPVPTIYFRGINDRVEAKRYDHIENYTFLSQYDDLFLNIWGADGVIEAFPVSRVLSIQYDD